jgi:hypothetical protein
MPKEALADLLDEWRSCLAGLDSQLEESTIPTSGAAGRSRSQDPCDHGAAG